MKVKICGLTNKDDAVWAINYGADYLGLNFYKESPRHVTLTTAAKWVPEIPSFASLVGVFVDPTVDDVVKAVTKLKLKGVQVHGEQPVEFFKELKEQFQDLERPPFIVKAFKVSSEESLAQLASFQDVVDYFLLDACVEGMEGGTGKTFDWSLAAKAKESGKPVFLAGGLNPNNVKQAAKKAQPYAVDVASGVEKTPRKKDLEKIKSFITNAKG